QLGQWMVRHRFAAVHEERNLVPRKDSFKSIVVRFEFSYQDADIPKPSTGAYVPQNLPRSKRGFGFGIGAKNNPQRLFVLNSRRRADIPVRSSLRMLDASGNFAGFTSIPRCCGQEFPRAALGFVRLRFGPVFLQVTQRRTMSKASNLG